MNNDLKITSKTTFAGYRNLAKYWFLRSEEDDLTEDLINYIAAAFLIHDIRVWLAVIRTDEELLRLARQGDFQVTLSLLDEARTKGVYLCYPFASYLETILEPNPIYLPDSPLKLARLATVSLSAYLEEFLAAKYGVFLLHSDREDYLDLNAENKYERLMYRFQSLFYVLEGLKAKSKDIQMYSSFLIRDLAAERRIAKWIIEAYPAYAPGMKRYLALLDWMMSKGLSNISDAEISKILDCLKNCCKLAKLKKKKDYKEFDQLLFDLGIE